MQVSAPRLDNAKDHSSESKDAKRKVFNITAVASPLPQGPLMLVQNRSQQDLQPCGGSVAHPFVQPQTQQELPTTSPAMAHMSQLHNVADLRMQLARTGVHAIPQALHLRRLNLDHQIPTHRMTQSVPDIAPVPHPLPTLPITSPALAFPPLRPADNAPSLNQNAAQLQIHLAPAGGPAASQAVHSGGPSLHGHQVPGHGIAESLSGELPCPPEYPQTALRPIPLHEMPSMHVAFDLSSGQWPLRFPGLSLGVQEPPCPGNPGGCNSSLQAISAEGLPSGNLSSSNPAIPLQWSNMMNKEAVQCCKYSSSTCRRMPEQRWDDTHCLYEWAQPAKIPANTWRNSPGGNTGPCARHCAVHSSNVLPQQIALSERSGFCRPSTLPAIHTFRPVDSPVEVASLPEQKSSPGPPRHLSEQTGGPDWPPGQVHMPQIVGSRHTTASVLATVSEQELGHAAKWQRVNAAQEGLIGWQDGRQKSKMCRGTCPEAERHGEEGNEVGLQRLGGRATRCPRSQPCQVKRKRGAGKRGRGRRIVPAQHSSRAVESVA